MIMKENVVVEEINRVVLYHNLSKITPNRTYILQNRKVYILPYTTILQGDTQDGKTKNG